jgi:hypothetical protein
MRPATYLPRYGRCRPPYRRRKRPARKGAHPRARPASSLRAREKLPDGHEDPHRPIVCRDAASEHAVRRCDRQLPSQVRGGARCDRDLRTFGGRELGQQPQELWPVRMYGGNPTVNGHSRAIPSFWGSSAVSVGLFRDQGPFPAAAGAAAGAAAPVPLAAGNGFAERCTGTAAGKGEHAVRTRSYEVCVARRGPTETSVDPVLGIPPR